MGLQCARILLRSCERQYKGHSGNKRMMQRVFKCKIQGAAAELKRMDENDDSEQYVRVTETAVGSKLGSRSPEVWGTGCKGKYRDGHGAVAHSQDMCGPVSAAEVLTQLTATSRTPANHAATYTASIVPSVLVRFVTAPLAAAATFPTAASVGTCAPSLPAAAGIDGSAGTAGDFAGGCWPSHSQGMAAGRSWMCRICLSEGHATPAAGRQGKRVAIVSRTQCLRTSVAQQRAW